jgi:nitrate reductase gamma subunit
MTALEVSGLAVLAIGIVLLLVGTATVLSATNRRAFKIDVAPERGSAIRGVAYAFTLGMAPWAKESTRRHLIAYMRGIVFHTGVFGALALLMASPWIWEWPEELRVGISIVLGIGAVAALGGFWIRFSEQALRKVSTPDDYFSLLLVTVFIATASAACVVESVVPGFWIVSGIVLAYLPVSKLKHSIYFFYTRFQFGTFFGHRGVLKISRRET